MNLIDFDEMKRESEREKKKDHGDGNQVKGIVPKSPVQFLGRDVSPIYVE